MPDVLIIGSGLAGMSAAVRLSDAGFRVTVLEANPYVGGRTSSWNEKGLHIESGLHRFLGFYTALPDLIRHVGVSLDDILCWEDEVEIRTAEGAEATLGLAPLHKPLKTAWGLIGHNDFLPPSDKLALGKMFAGALKDYESNPLELDNVTVADYAKKYDVSETAVTNLLTPLTEGIFFVPVSRYSMHNLVGLFAPYLSSIHKLRVGAFMGGMSEVMMQPMTEYVQAKGGSLLTDRPVDALVIEDDKVVGATSGTYAFRAEQVVLATSLHGAQELIRKAFGSHPHFADMLRLPSMPAVTFQIELNRPCMDIDRTTFGPGTVMASFAEQSRTTFQESKGRLSIILAQPEKYQHIGAAEILKDVQRDAKVLGIDLDGAVRDFRKVTIPHDFYALSTGSEVLRPPQKTPIPGLTLAGDYTKQPHLATMEGAVVSGQVAADLIINEG